MSDTAEVGFQTWITSWLLTQGRCALDRVGRATHIDPAINLHVVVMYRRTCLANLPPHRIIRPDSISPTRAKVRTRFNRLDRSDLTTRRFMCYISSKKIHTLTLKCARHIALTVLVNLGISRRKASGFSLAPSFQYSNSIHASSGI